MQNFAMEIFGVNIVIIVKSKISVIQVDRITDFILSPRLCRGFSLKPEFPRFFCVLIAKVLKKHQDYSDDDPTRTLNNYPAK